MRKFNVSALCMPEEDYMVDITGKLQQIKAMIDKREYFTINRGRQYGKTTTLFALEEFISDEYTVILLSFEGLGQEVFSSEKNFCSEFLNLIRDALELSGHGVDEYEKWENESVKDFSSLGRHIRQVCRDSTSKYVLMIDEVDKSSNNIIFLDFLSKLREKYIARKAKRDFTFHSVILAGVYDIKNIKLRLVQEGFHKPEFGETVINNSPWNIAADFDVSMSFSAPEIETMLAEYEKDYHTGMDISEIANEIHDYTNGYPVLVSRICKHIDEMLGKIWNVESVREAVKTMLQEDTPLFQSLVKNLTSNVNLSDLVYKIIMADLKVSFNLQDTHVNLGYRYGFFKRDHNRVGIANKIFEMCLTNYFISQELHGRIKAIPLRVADEEGVIVNDGFNMQTCLEKFAKYYDEYYSNKDVKFIEKHGRYFFLFFISSILNGSGFVHLESQSSDHKRRDVIVNFLDQQFIIELKIWRGGKLHDKAFSQLLGYMDKRGLNEGYLLTFDFRQKKEQKQEWVEVGDGKRVFNVIV